MSSTPESIPRRRRIQGGVAIAVGVLVAITVAIALIAVTSSNNPTLRTSASRSNPSPRPSAGMSQAGPGARSSGVAVGNTASRPTVQPNPDEQAPNLDLLHKVLPDWHGGGLPGWLLR